MQNYLHVVPSRPSSKVGGIGRFVTYFTREAGASHNVDVDTFATRLIDRSPWSHLTLPVAIGFFVYRLISKSPRLVHIHVAPRGSTWRKSIFLFVSKLFRKKTVIHLHGSGYNQYFSSRTKIEKIYIRKFFSSADAVIVLGQGWFDWAISKDGLTLSPVSTHIIDNGVPDPGVRAVRGNSITRILFVGEVGTRKGVDTLLEALKMLPNNVDWECRICGDGAVAELSEKARELNLPQEKIIFMGWQSESQVKHQMSVSDIYVLPSRAENQPIAILEAMAVGLPIVASDVGDIPNQISNGETGYLIPHSNPQILSIRILELIESQPKRFAMGDSARKRYEERYSISANVTKTLKLYENLLSRKTENSENVV